MVQMTPKVTTEAQEDRPVTVTRAREGAYRIIGISNIILNT